MKEKPSAATGTYHHGDLRNALIVQGRLQLEQLGPQELSLRSLARAVGVSEAAPSRHFAGKPGLLAAIAADGFYELAQIRDRIRGSRRGALDIAYQMMASYVSFGRTNRGLFNLMTGPRIIARDDYPELTAQSTRSFGAFSGAIANYARSCRWDDEALLLVAHGAWAMEHGLATLILSERVPRSDAPIDVDTMIEFAIHMYLTAIKAGPKALSKLAEKAVKDCEAALP